jgi:hypothetical protein
MDFWSYTTSREACKRSGVFDDPYAFYRAAFAEAVEMRSGRFYGPLHNERERARHPYYNVWASIVAMLTRLNLDLDSVLIRLPLPALCIRLPKQKNPLTFEWQGKETPVRCTLMGEIDQGRGLSVRIDVGEVMGDGRDFGVPVYTYRDFRRREESRSGKSDLQPKEKSDAISSHRLVLDGAVDGAGE